MMSLKSVIVGVNDDVVVDDNNYCYQ